MLDARSLARILLFLVLVAAPFTSLAAQSDPSRVRTLFHVNCASCHGENGDGHGTAELDRPARSFQDGGFSFGNTPEALFRTISVGIAGSPMPAFDSSLTEEERKLLADYVVTLGPPIEEVKEEDTILSVHDRPLIVRGLLPSLGEGLPWHPRGLLVGDPSGITFEYQVDDVRLLGLRQGGFVRRTDWTGRGGTALEPLGKVVHLVNGGKPDASFFLGGKPLVARLSGTRVGNEASLEYHVVEGQRELAHVEEHPRVLGAPFGTGYTRSVRLLASNGRVQLRTPLVPGATLLASGTSGREPWRVVRPSEGPPIFLSQRPGRAGAGPVAADGCQLAAELEKGDEAVTTVLVLTGFDDDVLTQIRGWMQARR